MERCPFLKYLTTSLMITMPASTSIAVTPYGPSDKGINSIIRRKKLLILQKSLSKSLLRRLPLSHYQIITLVLKAFHYHPPFIITLSHYQIITLYQPFLN